MGFRFRKSFRIAHGLRINLSKKGASFSLGGKGITTNVSRKGIQTTYGIPGTGLSYSTKRKGCLVLIMGFIIALSGILGAMAKIFGS